MSRTYTVNAYKMVLLEQKEIEAESIGEAKSDYLLEKLPYKLETPYEISTKRRFLTISKGSISYIVRYGKVEDPLYSFRADTPLKALLKLTKALAEAGEL